MNAIVFENAGFKGLNQKLSEKEYSSVWVLTDVNTQKYCLPILENAFDFPLLHINIPSGEDHKNIQTCEHIWRTLLHASADRKAVILNLGGGVIGDMGGFAATTYKRGIDFIQIPTTLLSMVDASVGGKLGIDFDGVKNAIGSFQNPALTCVYERFLETLPFRELRSGFAEVIKHGLIADKLYWEKICSIEDPKDPNIDWSYFIKKSVKIKSEIVVKDPREKGLRKILNFGHTIGHALESLSLESENHLLHGEAIAIGMICEAFLSVQLLGMDKKSLNEINDYISSVFSKPEISSYSEDRLLALIRNDKKNENTVMFSLLKSIGDATYNVNVSDELILKSLEYYTQ